MGSESPSESLGSKSGQVWSGSSSARPWGASPRACREVQPQEHHRVERRRPSEQQTQASHRPSVTQLAGAARRESRNTGIRPLERELRRPTLRPILVAGVLERALGEGQKASAQSSRLP